VTPIRVKIMTWSRPVHLEKRAEKFQVARVTMGEHLMDADYCEATGTGPDNATAVRAAVKEWRRWRKAFRTA
jgi:hypothetical protein